MHNRALIVRVVVALGVLFGMALSLPLWRTRVDYPRTPLFDFIPAFPQPLDGLVILAFVAVLGVLAWQPQFKGLAIVWLAAGSFLVLQDQSRLQPWFVEYALLLGALMFSRSERVGLNACRLILAAVYFWSGMHKMNTSFASNLFPWLISSLVKLSPESPLQLLGFAIPFLEMGMALALLFPKTRRIGVVAIVAMHLFLLIVLSPLALGWNGVVVPWNVAMMILAPGLFWQVDALPKTFFAVSPAFLVPLLVLPPLSLVGLWDTSPSFALYSGNQLIGSVVLSSGIWEHQRPETRAIAEHIGDRYRIRLDDWAVATTNVPAYPAERVLRPVARSFCSAAPNAADGDLIFILEQPPRWLYRLGWLRIERRGELCR